MRVRVSSSQTDSSISTATSMMKDRDLGNWVPKIENSGPSNCGGSP